MTSERTGWASGVFSFRVLERCLTEVAELHGSETARQARSVLGKYVLDQLIRDELIDASPIAGKRLDLAGVKGDTQTRGGVALSVDEWIAVIDYLLALDPAEGVEPPKRGMYTLEDRIAVIANAIDLTLLQSVTGLRVSEATRVDAPMLTFDRGRDGLRLAAGDHEDEKRSLRSRDRSGHRGSVQTAVGGGARKRRSFDSQSCQAWRCLGPEAA
ncbi:hypothetical protein GCM10010522_30240 [Kribbella solani]